MFLFVYFVEIFAEHNDKNFEFIEYDGNQAEELEISELGDDPFETMADDMYDESSEIDPFASSPEDELGSLSLDDQLREGEQHLQDVFQEDGLGNPQEEIRY